MKYVQNLNHKNNEYSFNYNPKDSSDKTLVINDLNKEEIRYQINLCKSPHIIQMY